MKNRGSQSPTYLILVVLILSVCLNIYLLLSPSLQAGSGGKRSLQELQELREPGVYGPDDIEVVEGSLYISAPGVRLQNTRINGDLFLTAGIGDGGVEVLRVAVRDTTTVAGGGVDTVVFEDAQLDHLVINRVEGKVRVVLKGNTVVEKVTIKGEAALSTAELTGEGLVRELNIETAAEVEIDGFYGLVNVAAGEARVTVVAGEVEKLCTGPEAEGALIRLLEGATVGQIEAGAPLVLESGGQVEAVAVVAPGRFKFSGNVGKVSAGGRGIFLEFGAGNTASLQVVASEGTVMVHLAAEAVIESIELDGAAGITGGGVIKRVKINASGTTIEQKPEVVELAVGVKAEVAGEALVKEEEVPLPTVNLGAVSNRVIGPGQSATIALSVSPGDASLAVSSSNASVAAVSLSGKNLIVRGGSAAGSAKITVRASKAGYNSTTRTFTVTVDPVHEFKIGENSLTPGNKVVTVTLRCSDPENYAVTVGGTPLKYYPDKKAFGGEVPEGAAKKSNVKVTRK